MNIVERAKNIIMTPKTEWPVISSETPAVGEIMLNYVLPLALIPAIAQCHRLRPRRRAAHLLVDLGGDRDGTRFVPDRESLAFISRRMWWISWRRISALQKNLGRAVQLVAYSYTPGWVAGILNIIPAIGMARVAGLTLRPLSGVSWECHTR